MPPCALHREQPWHRSERCPGAASSLRSMYFYTRDARPVHNRPVGAVRGAVGARPPGYGAGRGPVGPPTCCGSGEGARGAGRRVHVPYQPRQPGVDVESLDLFARRSCPRSSHATSSIVKDRPPALPLRRAGHGPPPADEAPALDPEYKFVGADQCRPPATPTGLSSPSGDGRRPSATPKRAVRTLRTGRPPITTIRDLVTLDWFDRGTLRTRVLTRLDFPRQVRSGCAGAAFASPYRRRAVALGRPREGRWSTPCRPTWAARGGLRR